MIVRTAAEGASEDELARDVKRLQAQWEDIQAKATSGGAPVLLYEEPDLVIRVVRDLFNEDFRELVVQGEESYGMVESYLSHVSPDLVEPAAPATPAPGTSSPTTRIDEQILKALDRKVFLPSGGSLVIDRTEAMTVVDVNTGKYTGAGGNLEETVTRNNLEAAEEIVRQLRLRDIGGIVVIDFIDMVLESNRELVLRRLTECLGRDRTKHQVTEITSLGLVQMTRKRIGAGLLEAFSETCECCKGRGVIIHTEPVPEKPRKPRRGREGQGRSTATAPAPAAGRRRQPPPRPQGGRRARGGRGRRDRRLRRRRAGRRRRRAHRGRHDGLRPVPVRDGHRHHPGGGGGRGDPGRLGAAGRRRRPGRSGRRRRRRRGRQPSAGPSWHRSPAYPVLTLDLWCFAGHPRRYDRRGCPARVGGSGARHSGPARGAEWICRHREVSRRWGGAGAARFGQRAGHGVPLPTAHFCVPGTRVPAV